MPSSPQTRSIRSRCTAFTLLELVVAITIILVLAALLFSGGRIVFGKSQAVKCESNLRQIGLGAQAWAAENNGAIVPSRTNFGADYYWPYLLAPYLGLPKLGTTPAGSLIATPYTCPVVKVDSNGNTQYSLGVYGIRYAINSHIAEVPDLLDSPSVTRKERMQKMQLSKTMIFIDSFTGGGLGFFSTIAPTYPHAGTANVLFLDGHVESRTAANIEQLKQIPYHVFWRGYDWGCGGYRED